MDNSIIKSIEVKALDSSKAEEIKQSLKTAEDDGSKLIQLNMDSSSGDIPTVTSLIEYIHNSSKSECVVSCKGVIDLASTLVAAGGKFLQRRADSTTLFSLYDPKVKLGKKRKELTPEEKNVLVYLDKFSGGKKSRIKALMLSNTKVTASEAVSLGLVDEVTGMVDRYAEDRAQAKAAKKSKGDK